MMIQQQINQFNKFWFTRFITTIDYFDQKYNLTISMILIKKTTTNETINKFHDFDEASLITTTKEHERVKNMKES